MEGRVSHAPRGEGRVEQGVYRAGRSADPSDLADLAVGSRLPALLPPRLPPTPLLLQLGLTFPLDCAPSVGTCLGGLHGNLREAWGSLHGDGLVLPRARRGVRPGQGASAAARKT